MAPKEVVVVKVVPQKLRRNERERKRVNQVNQGFNKLRERVPRAPGCKQKLSKVETLREAARYIQLLQSQLGLPCQQISFSNFPTPENSPNYPPPLNHQSQNFPYQNPQFSSQFPQENQKTQQQISPGSCSYYSDEAGSNYDYHMH
ncbi:unnamed protein product [Caenorhabditis angaria]|uniref:BHLH domain-containing protein n=1 Tax=Caenorhabditis angaria TaxID=860376 RepID=A0A9P1IAH8_9PELO|nr:unnamed protein product [Caenorhabditis angaria]